MMTTWSHPESLLIQYALYSFFGIILCPFSVRETLDHMEVCLFEQCAGVADYSEINQRHIVNFDIQTMLWGFQNMTIVMNSKIETLFVFLAGALQHGPLDLGPEPNAWKLEVWYHLSTWLGSVHQPLLTWPKAFTCRILWKQTRKLIKAYFSLWWKIYSNITIFFTYLSRWGVDEGGSPK